MAVTARKCMRADSHAEGRLRGVLPEPVPFVVVDLVVVDGWRLREREVNVWRHRVADAQRLDVGLAVRVVVGIEVLGQAVVVAVPLVWAWPRGERVPERARPGQ